jgi:dCTP deaminase
MIVNGRFLTLKAPIKNMIEEKKVFNGYSYGLSEAGYDFRIKQRVIFRAPKIDALMDIMRNVWHHGSNYELTEEDKAILYGSVTVHTENGPKTTIGRTALASSIEEFEIPSDLWCEFRNKSSHARRFLDASITTDGEPGWTGFLTIELVFNGMADYILEPGTPILKAVFHQLMEPREYTGKYSHQPDRPIEAIMEKGSV